MDDREIETRKRERAAFKAGSRHQFDWLGDMQQRQRRENAGRVTTTNAWDGAKSEAAARERYPIKVRKPREARLESDSSLVARINEFGAVVFGAIDADTVEFSVDYLSTADVRLLADLVARPFDVVDE